MAKQTDLILMHMKKYGSITHLEAESEYGICGGGPMMLDDVIEIKVPAPDSQYRLLPCKKCQSDNVAYEHYNGRGGAAWRCKCFDCGHTVDKGNKVRHDAQINWNKECKV